MKKPHPSPKRVQPENRRIFRITQFAYLFGLIGHLMMVITFHQLNIKELLWFNILYSIPAFSVALGLNRRGHHDLAFLFAFIELYSHQVYGVYLLGWDTGFQYFLIYVAGLSFFIDHRKKRSQVAILSLLKQAQILEELRLKVKTSLHQT